MYRFFFVIIIAILEQTVTLCQQTAEPLSVRKLSAREIKEMCISGEIPSYKLEEQLYESRYAISAKGMIMYNAQISSLLNANAQATVMFNKSMKKLKELNTLKNIAVPYFIVAGIFGLSMSIAGVESKALDIAYVAVYGPFILGAIYCTTLRPSSLRYATEAVALYNGQQDIGNKQPYSTLSFGITAGGLGLKVNF